MKKSAISPFVSTVILITATFMIGGFLLTQFQGFVNRYVTQPAIEFTGAVAVPESTSLTVSVKNTGNIALAIKDVQVFINGVKITGTIDPVLSSTSPLNLQPGKTATLSITTSQTLRTGESLSLVIVSDQITKGFTVPIA